MFECQTLLILFLLKSRMPFLHFTDRCGHGQMAENLPDERSPVFLQFLDVLYQLLVQFPNAFEFTDTLLLFLADHLNSCLFGNFLGKHLSLCEHQHFFAV